MGAWQELLRNEKTVFLHAWNELLENLRSVFSGGEVHFTKPAPPVKENRLENCWRADTRELNDLNERQQAYEMLEKTGEPISNYVISTAEIVELEYFRKPALNEVIADAAKRATSGAHRNEPFTSVKERLPDENDLGRMG